MTYLFAWSYLFLLFLYSRHIVKTTLFCLFWRLYVDLKISFNCFERSLSAVSLTLPITPFIYLHTIKTITSLQSEVFLSIKCVKVSQACYSLSILPVVLSKFSVPQISISFFLILLICYKYWREYFKSIQNWNLYYSPSLRRNKN